MRAAALHLHRPRRGVDPDCIDCTDCPDGTDGTGGTNGTDCPDCTDCTFTGLDEVRTHPAAAAAFAIRKPLPIACATPRAERHGQSGGERRRDDGLPLPFLDSPRSPARARVQ
eukprot:360011-Prymnesium_polylepis.1